MPYYYGSIVLTMENAKNEQIAEKEKPPFFYHGSPHGAIEEFEPRVSKGSGEKYGALVYATQDLATASVFMAKVEREWSAGRFNNISYVLIPMSRDKFIENDKGGYIYVLPSDTFITETGRGMGEYEWASKEKVKPVKKIEYVSALDAMIENGVQVYFVDMETYERIKTSEDHGFSIIKNLKSENQNRNTNVRQLDRKIL